jgi:DNA-binding NarL/FixJ family response regulator
MPVRLLVTDDHGVLREGVISILADYPEFEVVAEAEDGKQTLELARETQPDVVVLDLVLPVMDGFQVAQRLRQSHPTIKIVVLSALTELEVVDQAMAMGVDAYVSKTRCLEDLVDALHLVAEGERFISPGLSRYAPVTPAFADRSSQMELLTSRELQVMGLVADGLTNKQIARRLGISVHTVRSHRQRLMDKLDIHDTATLTRLAMSWGVMGQPNG